MNCQRKLLWILGQYWCGYSTWPMDQVRPGPFVVVAVTFLFLEVLGSLSRSVSGSTCEAIRIPMCRSMPYNITQIPNLLHHSNQLNALLVLEQYQPLVSTSCSPVLLFFLCAIFTPVCPVNFSQDVIPPCKDVCLRARRGCEPVLEGYNLTWPQDLDCDGLPPYETGVCISPEAINSSPPKRARMILKRKAKTSSEPKQQLKRNDTTTKDCPSLTKLVSRKKHNGRSFHFVIRATLMKVQTLGSGQLSLGLLVRETFKTSSFVHLNVNQSLTVLSSLRSIRKVGQCAGLHSLESYRLNEDYLILGQEQAAKRSLVCQSDCRVLPWRKHFHKAIQSSKRQQKKPKLKRNPSTSTNQPNRKPSRKRA